MKESNIRKAKRRWQEEEKEQQQTEQTHTQIHTNQSQTQAHTRTHTHRDTQHMAEQHGKYQNKKNTRVVSLCISRRYHRASRQTRMQR